MSLSPINTEKGRVFNNADSFAIAFDEAWKKFKSDKEGDSLLPSNKLETILHELKDHPFMKDSPSMAYKVAEFRIKLLKLV